MDWVSCWLNTDWCGPIVKDLVWEVLLVKVEIWSKWAMLFTLADMLFFQWNFDHLNLCWMVNWSTAGFVWVYQLFSRTGKKKCSIIILIVVTKCFFFWEFWTLSLMSKTIVGFYKFPNVLKAWLVGPTQNQSSSRQHITPASFTGDPVVDDCEHFHVCVVRLRPVRVESTDRRHSISFWSQKAGAERKRGWSRD